MKTAKELAKELRPTMPEEVLRAWALDAKAVLERVAEAAPAEAKYGECAICHQPYERFDSPGGVFYSHFTHPQDDHDAAPLPAPWTQGGEVREALALTLFGSDPDGGWGQSAEWERTVFYDQAVAVLARYTLVPIPQEEGVEEQL